MSPAALDRELVDEIAARVTAAVLQELRGAGVLPAADRRVSNADQAAASGLLPAMWAACGVQVLAVADLINHARLHPGLATAIEQATGTVLDEAATPLGRLLRRAQGCNVGGLQVHRVGLSRKVALWQLGFRPTAAEGFGSPAGPSLATTALGAGATTATR